MSTKKEKHLEKGQKHQKKGSNSKAISEYQSALALDPNDTPLRLRICELMVRLGNKEEAIEEYGKVAKDHTQKGFYLKAIAVHKQMLKLDDANMDMHYKLADLYAKQRLNADSIKEYSLIISSFEKKGKTTEVLDILKKMVDVDPENVGVKIKLAEMYIQLGFEQDAFKEYKWVADKLINQEKFEKAEKLLINLYKNHGEEPTVLESLSDLYIAKQDKILLVRYGALFLNVLEGDEERADDAASYAQEILKLDPNNSDAKNILKKLGISATVAEPAPEEVKDEPEIKEEPAAEVAPEEPSKTEEASPLISFPEDADDAGDGDVVDEVEGIEELEELEELEEIEEIEEVAEIEEEIAPPSPTPPPAPAAAKEEVPDGGYVDLEAELALEESLEGIGEDWADDDEDAKEEFKEAVGEQLSKEDTETHLNLGIAYMEMELFSESIKEFKLILKDPDLKFEAYTKLAICELRSGNEDGAISAYLNALKVENTTEEERKAIMYELGLSYEVAGKSDEARGMFNAVNEMDGSYREVSEKIALYGAGGAPKDDDMVEVEIQ